MISKPSDPRPPLDAVREKLRLARHRMVYVDLDRVARRRQAERIQDLEAQERQLST